MVIRQRSRAPVITAYATTELAPATIRQFRDDFAVGAFARYDPTLEVKLVTNPEFFDLSPETIRRRVDTETNFRDFNPVLILDSETAGTRSVWWVGEWATQEDYEEQVVREPSGEPVLWKMRVMTIDVALIYSNLEIANMSLSEMLDRCPYDPDAPQIPYRLGLDYSKERPPPVYLTALPGEWEESMDEDIRARFSPRPDRVVRLKEEIAEKENLRNDWTIGWRPRDEDVPKGSLSFAQYWHTEEVALVETLVVDGVTALDPTRGVDPPLEDPDQMARMRAMFNEAVESTDDESRGQKEEEEEREEEPAAQEPIFQEWERRGRGRGDHPHQSRRPHHPHHFEIERCQALDHLQRVEIELEGLSLADLDLVEDCRRRSSLYLPDRRREDRSRPIYRDRREF